MPTNAQWMPLTPEQAHQLFHVPLASASAGGVSFYELSTNPRTDPARDGPWPLLVLQQDADTPQVVTLRWATVDPELLDLATYNPLEWPGGYLLLDGRGVTALVDWLRALAERLSPAPPSGRPPFTRLPLAELAAYGLDDEAHEGHRQSFHLQPVDPRGDSAEKAVVILSAIEPLPAWWLFLGIRHVRANPGQDGEPSPLAFIHLDRPGLTYLADTLAAELPYLVAQP